MTQLSDLLGSAKPEDLESDDHRASVRRRLSRGINRTLLPQRRFLVDDELTLADICFVAELALFSNERARRRSNERVAPDVEPYLQKIDRAAS